MYRIIRSGAVGRHAVAGAYILHQLGLILRALEFMKHHVASFLDGDVPAAKSLVNIPVFRAELVQ